MSCYNCYFLICIQVSQEASKMVWYSHLFQNFPPFIMIHTVKGFGIFNKAEVDGFLELSCFFFFFFYLWWILSYIEMKQPWVYMCSPSWSPLPPPSPPAPSRFSQCTRSEPLSHASNLGSLAFSMTQQMLAIWSLAPLPFLNPAWTFKNLERTIQPSPSPTESKSLFCTSVSLFLFFL